MKLPPLVTNLLRPKENIKEFFLSLLLDQHGILGEIWEFDNNNKIKSHGYAKQILKTVNFEQLLISADKVIVELEEKAKSRNVYKTVLGLSTAYLEETGEIQIDFKKQIKKLSQELKLQLLGFIPLPQAVIYYLKQQEGIPPSVILLGISSGQLTVSLYKIGVLKRQETIESDANLLVNLEHFFSACPEEEVLPSRFLLYGLNKEEIGKVQAELLRHAWTTKANFLHFPKIEQLSEENLIAAVSLGGASEIKTEFGDVQEIVEPVVEEEKEDVKVNETAEIQEESNLEVVAPDELGFQTDTDILEQVAQPKIKTKLPVKMPSLKILPLLAKFKEIFRLPNFKKPANFSALPLVIILFIIFVLGYLGYFFIPRATVTVLTLAHKIDYSTTVIIDPNATESDLTAKTIIGKKQEKVLSASKTIPVTGKKKVGDPAKGILTIYNKSTSGSKSFSKGTVVSAGNLQFTLDNDVSVASASDNIGSATYGKNTVAITAVEIGPDSNLSAGKEFLFPNVSRDIVAGRNEQALTGGTSREVNVVSRNDYDNLVKVVTDELINQAKNELGSQVGGGEKLLESTLKTTVTEKTFVQELDQESAVVEGKITANVSGVSYAEAELKDLLQSLISESVPQGYLLVPERFLTQLSNFKVAKDGKVSAKVVLEALALPVVEQQKIQRQLSGKKITQAQSILQQINGVSGVEFNFRYSLSKNRLPINWKNISLGVEIQE